MGLVIPKFAADSDQSLHYLLLLSLDLQMENCYFDQAVLVAGYYPGSFGRLPDDHVLVDASRAALGQSAC